MLIEGSGLLALLLLWAAMPAVGQTISVLTAHWPLKWPHTPGEVAVANRLPLSTISSFLGSSGSGPAAIPTKLYGFRFAYLERGRVYLITSVGTRYGWLGTLFPIGDARFKVTSGV